MIRRILSRLVARFQGDAAGAVEMLPPPELQQFVGGDYQVVGAEFLRYLVEFANLRPDGRLLDIGCGSGRIAVPLTSYLNSNSEYHGFDVSPTAIRWCRRAITSRFPNFTFQVADVQNGPYNPNGKCKPSDYRFPYPDASFDVVLLASVFTHMLPVDVKNYVAQIRRVLRPGGRCLATFFLLNEESTRLIALKKGKLNFEYGGEGFRTIDNERPEEAVAYPESFVTNILESAGLHLSAPIRYGSWCGRENFTSFQDLAVSTRSS